MPGSFHISQYCLFWATKTVETQAVIGFLHRPAENCIYIHTNKF